MSKIVRTRFAPSPTGFMHVGGVRTALFAWLVARQADGKFILRIEDTDKTREVAGSEQHIMDSLKWLGIEWDEGPDKGGPHGPYRQSERLGIYEEWAQKLIDKGRAYADPRSPEELDKLRADAKTKNAPFLIRNYPLEKPQKWEGGIPLRFKAKISNYNFEDSVTETWDDVVMGKIGYTEQALDDFIIIKSDGYPTYNFAHIIDDHLMQITHVIRSQEFLPSVPKFLNLYEALGLERPILATLPYVLGPDGKKKLSKRDGAKDILGYKKEGYLPEALVNFLATLGWNDGTEQETFTIDELIKKFKLGRVQKSGARFDEQRLEWMNGYWIRELPIDALHERAKSFWPKSADSQTDSYKKQVLGLIQERLKYLAEIPQLTGFFFEDLPIDLKLITGNKQLAKLDKEELRKLLEISLAKLEDSDFSTGNLTEALNGLLEETGQKPAVLFSLIRVATTWAPASPGLAETLHVLGKDKSLARLKKSAETLAQKA